MYFSNTATSFVLWLNKEERNRLSTDLVDIAISDEGIVSIVEGTTTLIATCDSSEFSITLPKRDKNLFNFTKKIRVPARRTAHDTIQADLHPFLKVELPKEEIIEENSDFRERIASLTATNERLMGHLRYVKSYLNNLIL